MTTNPDGKPYIHNAEQSEAAKHGRMILPTTQPTHADLAWYVRELAQANEHKDDWMAKHCAIQSECAKLRAALTAALSVLDEHAEEERKFWGAEDKHGLASEAEKIHEQARAALSSPNVADESRAEKAERAETVALANWNGALERAIKAEAELAAAKERLRSEAMDDYASIKDLQRELATERARLNWLETPSGMDWQWEPERLTVSRASIDAAMKEDAK